VESLFFIAESYFLEECKFIAEKVNKVVHGTHNLKLILLVLLDVCFVLDGFMQVSVLVDLVLIVLLAQLAPLEIQIDSVLSQRHFFS